MIPVGHKFAMIALCGVRMKEPDEEPKPLADNVWLTFSAPAVFDDS
jgi:hypothetical protein